MRDVDRIIELVRCELPAAEVQQLQVKHPEADDDGLWFFWLPGVSKDIQIESSTGTCPFVIEHDDMTETAREALGVSAEITAKAIVDYLRQVAEVDAESR